MLIEVGRLFDGSEVCPRAAGIRVDGGRIVAVGPIGDFPADEPRAFRWPTMTAIPGLVDSHVHLELSGASERAQVRDRFAADLAAGTLQATAKSNAATALRSGVTTLRDCGSTPSLLAFRASVAARSDLPRMVLTGPPITTARGQLCWLGRVATTRDEVVTATREILAGGADALKVMASGGLLTEESDPLRPQYPAATLRAAVEIAHEANRRVVVHALPATATVLAAEAGADSVDHATWLGEDGGDGWTEDGAERVARCGAVIGLTAAGRARALLDSDDGAAEIERQARRHRDLLHRGVRVGVHSDAGGSRTGFDGFADSLRVAALGLGLDNLAVLRMGTAGAAQEIGLGHEVGRIATGYAADLVIIDGDPVRELADLRRVVSVLRNGVEATAAHGGTGGRDT